MNREEILKKSQSENHGRDIADLEVSRRGVFAGWIVLVCLALGVAVTDGVLFGRMPFELLFAVAAALAVVFFCKFAALKKKHELLVALCYSVGAAAFFAAWLLQLLQR